MEFAGTPLSQVNPAGQSCHLVQREHAGPEAWAGGGR